MHWQIQCDIWLDSINSTVKHLISAVSNFSQFYENDILESFYFGVHNMPLLKIEKKTWCKCVTFFYNFLLNYTLCQLLESPHRGNYNGITMYSFMARYNKYLTWVYGVDSKICHEGHWSASQVMPNSDPEW